MKEGHVFRSFTDTGNIYSHQVLQNKTLENFLSHLKTSLDYEQAAIYIYDNIQKDTNIELIRDAINFILHARFNIIDPEQYIEFKDLLFTYSDVIQVVQLTRVYKRHKEYHYLFVCSYFDGEELNIIIPVQLNYYSLLRVPLVNIPFSHLGNYHVRPKPTYEDCNHFIEFKQRKVNAKQTIFLFQSVCEINMEVSEFSPILRNRLKTKYDSISYDRKAQVILILCPDDAEFQLDYFLDLSLIIGQRVIKNNVITHNSQLDLEKIIDKFIFPLNESYELISEWNLDPELTEEFMSKDYESFWQLKEMVQI